MKSRLIKIFLSAGLSAALMIAPATVSAAESGQPGLTGSGINTAVQSKEEVVYATLAADGSVNAAYTVNHFELSTAGHVTDYGRYSSVMNLTNTNPLENDGASVSFQAEEGNFYYQGNMASTALPWLFDISYDMNGAKVAASALAGQSGDLTIHITTAPNDSVNPVFYDNYLLQISITLDTDKYSNITAPDATIASAGKNTVINYTVMPKKDADISISATVNDFTMTGIQISGMPLSMNLDAPNTDDMLGDFGKLSDAISDLNGGVGDLADGAASLKKGAQDLENGSADIRNGLLQLRDNSGQLIAASSQINTALSQIASSLSGALSGGTDANDLAQLPQTLTQLSAGLKSISVGLSDLKDGFSAAYTALDAAIQGIPDTALTQDQINTLYSKTDSSQYGVLDTLTAAYTAGQTVKGTYNQVKDAFDAVSPTIDTITGSIGTIAASLDQISQGVSESLSGSDIMGPMAELSGGLSQLSQNYADFNKGLADYMSGVSTAASGYTSFHDGLSRFGDGMGDFYDGITELHEGTGKLNDETADMPETMQTEIDDLMNEYTGSDFQPVSFASPQNQNVSLVQFVFKSEAIEKPDVAEQPDTEQKNETLWNRFISLF